MLFNSFQFYLFFIAVFALYWLLPHKRRPLLLLIASYYFYMCYEPVYLLLLLTTTVMCYFTGKFIEKYRDKAKLISFVNIFICFSILFYFKYLNFAIESLVSSIEFLNIMQFEKTPILNIILPIGISFHTFQNVGYTIDVYRKKIKAKKDFLQFALFSSYFPQLVAGPIERSNNLMPQLEKEHFFNYNQAVSGMVMILVGFIKKVAIADTIAIYVDAVYNNVSEFTGIALIVATVLFAFQIYCDFSGYSDMAIGFSKLLGIELMNNFKSPYLSKSITEFWRRWHISLSSWFKDYVYIPLGGSRTSLIKNIRNLIITFLISGIWHGANWTFVIWGLYHGLLLVIELMLRKNNVKIKLPEFIKLIGTFTLVGIGWVFFRANSVSDALYVLKNMFNEISLSPSYFINSLQDMGFTTFSLVMVFILIIVLFIVDYFNRDNKIDQYILSKSKYISWLICLVGVGLVLFCMMFLSESQNFIYFQF